jgi:hypothetical protein
MLSLSYQMLNMSRKEIRRLVLPRTSCVWTASDFGNRMRRMFGVYERFRQTSQLPSSGLMTFASTVILGFGSRRSHDHIILSHDSGDRVTLEPIIFGRSGKFMLALVSTVIRGSGSRGTHDHIFLPHKSGSSATTFYEIRRGLVFLYKSCIRECVRGKAVIELTQELDANQ